MKEKVSPLEKILSIRFSVIPEKKIFKPAQLVCVAGGKL